MILAGEVRLGYVRSRLGAPHSGGGPLGG